MAQTSLSIRPLRACEHEPLRQLRLRALLTDPDAFGSTYAREVALPTERWQRWAELSAAGVSQRTFVLVDSDDQWLGLALVRLDGEQPTLAELNAMWVAPEARRSGGALRLCDACVAWAAESGSRELQLSVVVSNAAARRAYERAGFRVQRRELWNGDDGRTLDEFIMVRRLASVGGRHSTTRLP